MTRWSLRGRRPRTSNADPSTSRSEVSRPEEYRPPDAARAVSHPPPDGRPAAEGSPRPDTAGDYLREATFTPRQVADAATSQPPSAWPEICEQFGLHLLVLAEQLRISLDELEADEADPERLQRLYRIDHAVTRMRSASRDLRTLAGQGGDELAGPVTSLLDVIRMAQSAIERYSQVTVAKVADLAVLGYAADDVGSLMAALLDNATRYSPGPVTVSAHLAADGSVLFRVEDTGIGITPDMVAGINAMLKGPVREVDERTGLHSGFPVVHRIARKHQIGVRLAGRLSPASGTTAMVTLPAHLLCEIPHDLLDRPASALAPRPSAEGVTLLSSAARRRPGRAEPRRRTWPDRVDDPEAPASEPVVAREPALASEPALGDGLPRRERASLRGDRPRRGGGADGEPSPPLSPEAQAAARRAFANDIAAFTTGSGESIGKGTAP
jgi:Histidine kinase-, DNA gyrase B-, and HSP90-like ATPase